MPELLFEHPACEWTSIRTLGTVMVVHCQNCVVFRDFSTDNCVASGLIATASLGDLCVFYDHRRISLAETASEKHSEPIRPRCAVKISETNYCMNDRPGKDYQ